MKNSLMKKYESMGFDKGQLEEIRQGVEKGLDVSWYTSVKYDWFQMEEIKKGLERGLDVSVYAREELTYDRMRQIRKGLQDGIKLSEYQSLSAGYLRQIRKAKQGNVNIFPYIQKGYEPDQLEEIRLALEHQDLKKLARYHLEDCNACGCCSFICPAQIPLVETVAQAANFVKRGGAAP